MSELTVSRRHAHENNSIRSRLSREVQEEISPRRSYALRQRAVPDFDAGQESFRTATVVHLYDGAVIPVGSHLQEMQRQNLAPSCEESLDETVIIAY